MTPLSLFDDLPLEDPFESKAELRRHEEHLRYVERVRQAEWNRFKVGDAVWLCWPCENPHRHWAVPGQVTDRKNSQIHVEVPCTDPQHPPQTLWMPANGVSHSPSVCWLVKRWSEGETRP